MTDPAVPPAEPPGEPPRSVPPTTSFGNDAAPVFPPPAEQTGRSRAPFGPGLWESLLWILGFFAIELVGGAVWVLGVMLFDAASTGRMTPPNQIADRLKPIMPWMIGSVKLAEVLAALVAIRLRFGPRAFRVTGFRAVPLPHVVILGLAVLPTAFLSGQSYALFSGYWNLWTQDNPFLRSLNDMSSIKEVQEMAEATPLAVLVLIIAVFPALNEEFVFRAAVGRGLLARYGLVAGIALTSMLFAAVHLSPVHAAALLPLAVLMHVGYLSSGSIWACVGVHFLNNALSVGLMKLATVVEEVGGVAADVTDTKFSPLVFLSSSACVAATVWLLWHLRVRWLLPDGSEWRTDFPSTEPPPLGADAVPVVPGIPAGPLWVTAVAYLSFPVAFGVAAALRQL